MKNNAQNNLLELLSADQIFISYVYTTGRTDTKEYFKVRNIPDQSKKNVKHKQETQKTIREIQKSIQFLEKK